MNGAWRSRVRTGFVGALGVTILLLGTPLLAQAEQGKWWKSAEGDRKSDRTVVRDQRGSDRMVRRGRRPDGGSRGNITYRDRRYSGRASWGRHSTWRGLPVRRDVLVIRDHRNGRYFRARRLYCAPRYYGRFVYVRPVRYFIAANAVIGGVSIRARIGRPHYLYGCNFCDDRFDTYDAYAMHVGHCHYRPSGLQVSVSNWDDGYDHDWHGPYQAGDDGYHDQNHDGGQADDGYYDE